MMLVVSTAGRGDNPTCTPLLFPERRVKHVPCHIMSEGKPLRLWLRHLCWERVTWLSTWPVFSWQVWLEEAARGVISRHLPRWMDEVIVINGVITTL